MKKNEIIGYRTDDKYQKSNYLIQAKYTGTLLEERILAVALSKLQHSKVSKNEDYKVSFTPGELRSILGSSSNSLYSDARKAVKKLQDRQLYMEDPVNRQFMFMNLVTLSKYNDGYLEIYFNNHLKPFLKGISDSYAVLQISVMTKFKSVYSFRLYELLKSMAYTRKGDTNPYGKYILEYELDELRFTLGVCNSEEKKVKAYMDGLNGKEPDYKYAYSLVVEKKYEEWREFKRILDKAVDGINNNEAAGMKVIMERLKAPGSGGKTKGVRFIVEYIKKDLKASVIPEPTQEEKDSFIDNLSDYIEEPLKIKDLRAIAEAANYNMQKIETAYRIAGQNGTDNLTGFMIAAIKKGYEEPVKKAKTMKNSFNDFPQRDYDFNEIEKILVEN